MEEGPEEEREAKLKLQSWPRRKETQRAPTGIKNWMKYFYNHTHTHIPSKEEIEGNIEKERWREMANRERKRWAAEGYWWGATVKGNPRKKETPTCLSNMKEPKVGRGFGWCGCGAVGRWYHKSHELTWGSWVESFMDAHRHDRWSEHAHWATAHRPTTRLSHIFLHFFP